MGRKKDERITWDVIFQDYKKRHSKKAKEVLHYCPHSFATILLYFPNRCRALYNYDTKEFRMLSKKEVDDMIRKDEEKFLRFK